LALRKRNLNIKLLNEAQLYSLCLKKKSEAQKELYDRYAPQMFSICRRYSNNNDALAEDLLQEAFFKIFTKLNQCKDPEKMSGWIKRVVVNTALEYLRKNTLKMKEMEGLENLYADQTIESKIISSLDEAQILKLIEEIPEGCRTVFNAFIIDGLSHKEISDVLGISISASKTRLNDARKRLKKSVGLLYSVNLV